VKSPLLYNPDLKLLIAETMNALNYPNN